MTEKRGRGRPRKHPKIPMDIELDPAVREALEHPETWPIVDAPIKRLNIEVVKGKRRRGGGGPTIYHFTEEIAEALIYHVSTGLTYEQAATRIGLPRHVMKTWMSRGAVGREPYETFARRVDAARVAKLQGILIDWEGMAKGQLYGAKAQYYGIAMLGERLFQDTLSLKNNQTNVQVNIDQSSVKAAIVEAEQLAIAREEEQRKELENLSKLALPQKQPDVIDVEFRTESEQV